MQTETTYPDGGTPPQITTSTTQPSAALPNTGAGHAADAGLAGGIAVVVGVALLVAVAKARRPRWMRRAQ